MATSKLAALTEVQLTEWIERQADVVANLGHKSRGEATYLAICEALDALGDTPNEESERLTLMKMLITGGHYQEHGDEVIRYLNWKNSPSPNPKLDAEMVRRHQW